MPPGSYNRPQDDPILRLPVGDELQAELSEAIDARLQRGERHTHPKRGGCQVCAVEVAETVVRYLERNTRVIQSDALAPEEHTRARAAMKAMPYLGSGSSLRLTGELAVHPKFPTVDDLLADIESIRDRLKVVVDHDNERDRELRVYRKWREAVADLATQAEEVFEMLDARSIDDVEG